jgi:hypothetical protein
MWILTALPFVVTGERQRQHEPRDLEEDQHPLQATRAAFENRSRAEEVDRRAQSSAAVVDVDHRIP